MMTDKQTSEYILNKLLMDIETENINKFCNDNMFPIDIEKIRSKEFRNELERRIKKVHEYHILTNAYEYIKQTLDRYNYDDDADKTETP
jgi:hypothetical protein